MKKALRFVSALGLCLALILVFSIHPSQTQAANTYSIDLESGSSQYLTISDASQTGLDLTGDFTLEAWVKPESQPSGSFMTIIGKRNNSWQGYSLKYRESGGTYYLFLSLLTGSDPERTYEYSSGSPILPTGSWSHVAASVTANTEVTLYVNGASVFDTSSGVYSAANSDAAFTIGANNDTVNDPYFFFDGKIDDVRAWNIARTGTQIADDKSHELNGNETGLVGYWKLNNDLTDSSSNGNNLTNNGSAVHSSDTPFSGFTEVLAVRKPSNESVVSSTVLQNDDALSLQLAASKTYIIDGVIFATSTSATPDIMIGFFGQTGVDLAVGYTNDTNEMVLTSGETSSRIALPANTPTSIHIKGTIVTGSTSGDFRLKWAQATSNANATTVLKGSYLRAVEI